MSVPSTPSAINQLISMIRLAEYDHNPNDTIEVCMKDLILLKDEIVDYQEALVRLHKRVSVAEAIVAVSKMEKPRKKRLDEYV